MVKVAYDTTYTYLLQTFTESIEEMLDVLFFLLGDSWRLNYIYRLFGTLSHLHRRCKLLTPPLKMEQTECSKTSAHKIQTPGNHPKEIIQHSELGESLKSRPIRIYVTVSSKNSPQINKYFVNNCSRCFISFSKCANYYYVYYIN
jgi:hypothetical protein